MLPIGPPAYFQVRDVAGHLQIIGEWTIARVEIDGTQGNLSMMDPEDHEKGRVLDERGINVPSLQVEVVCQAAGTVRLASQQALSFLRWFYGRHSFHIGS